MAGFKLRAVALTAALAIVGTTLAAAPALAHKGFGAGKAITAEKITKATDRMSNFLNGLVASGTITQAQADAILTAKKADLEARAAKVAEFQTKAKAIIAAAYGLSVADFEAKAAAKTLPKLTVEQRTALKTQLDTLAQSLGLDRLPKGVGYGKRR